MKEMRNNSSTGIFAYSININNSYKNTEDNANRENKDSLLLFLLQNNFGKIYEKKYMDIQPSL